MPIESSPGAAAIPCAKTWCWRVAFSNGELLFGAGVRLWLPVVQRLLSGPDRSEGRLSLQLPDQGPMGTWELEVVGAPATRISGLPPCREAGSQPIRSK